MERCNYAVKFIRAEENKVPKLRFLFTPTSSTTVQKVGFGAFRSPLHCKLNPKFKFNSSIPNNVPAKVEGIRELSKYTKQYVKILGVNSSFLYSELKLKEEAKKTKEVTMEIEKHVDEILIPETQKKPVIETKESEMQTDQVQCIDCLERNKRIFLSKGTQVFPLIGKTSISIQTDEEDYREPIVQTLSQMTAAQLVAIRDFSAILMEPRPQNSVEMFSTRERIMDIFNLSQRDADAVRIAQRNRLDDHEVIDKLRFHSKDNAGGSVFSRLDGPPTLNINPEFEDDRAERERRHRLEEVEMEREREREREREKEIERERHRLDEEIRIRRIKQIEEEERLMRLQQEQRLREEERMRQEEIMHQERLHQEARLRQEEHIRQEERLRQEYLRKEEQIRQEQQRIMERERMLEQDQMRQMAVEMERRQYENRFEQDGRFHNQNANNNNNNSNWIRGTGPVRKSRGAWRDNRGGGAGAGGRGGRIKF